MKCRVIWLIFLSLCFSPDYKIVVKASNSLSGNFEDKTKGWITSHWLGIYYQTNSEWIYHIDLEWVFPSKDQTGGFWFYHPVANWFWSDSEVFPWLYFHQLSTWVYLEASGNSLNSDKFF